MTADAIDPAVAPVGSVRATAPTIALSCARRVTPNAIPDVATAPLLIPTVPTYADPPIGRLTAHRIAALSRWIDAASANAARDPEAATWGRLAKVAEEAGEVIAAYIGATGQNPRKGVTHTMGDVRRELLDVALTALCAVEHLDSLIPDDGGGVPDHTLGTSLTALYEHVEAVAWRAGVPMGGEDR